ncbi:MAG: hypothetical protein ACFFEV_10810, partial [Candidatus Thorarchaeota archaeon]
FVKARKSPMLDNIVVTEISESIDSRYSTIFIVVLSIVCGFSLGIIGKEEIERIKKRCSSIDLE